MSESVLRRSVAAFGWSAFGQITAQLLRFAANLVLTRLLFPEAFGLMAITQAIITGFILVSDFGFSASIVQSRKGSAASFLNTAWTLQILRGAILYVLALGVAYPVAGFYGIPDLGPLLATGSLVLLIAGFNSTKLALADRNLQAKRVVLIELGTYVAGLTLTIVWAWLDRSVWPLVWGNVLAAALKMISSHLLDGPANRLHLDLDAVKQLLSFGQWILISSALTFIVGEGSRLVVAAFMDLTLLACFGLALNMTRSVTQVMQQVASRVSFAVYAEMDRTAPDKLYQSLRRNRLILLIPAASVIALFALFGRSVMHYLYDARYADSGWMLQVLAVGTLAWVLHGSYGGLLMAKGMVKILTGVLLVEGALQIAGIWIGAQLFGARGMVMGFASASWLLYPILAAVFAKLGVWQKEIDLPYLAVIAAIAAFSLHS